MSNTSKGAAHERRAMEIIKANNPKCLVHKTVHSSLFKTQWGWRRTAANDIFGCFDLLVIAPNGGPTLIQVTDDTMSSGSSGNRKVKIDERVPFAPTGIDVEIWAWHGDHRFFRVYRRNERLEWAKAADIARKGIVRLY